MAKRRTRISAVPFPLGMILFLGGAYLSQAFPPAATLGGVTAVVLMVLGLGLTSFAILRSAILTRNRGDT